MTTSPDVRWHEGHVDREDRARVTGGNGLVVWLTGLSGSGKSTIGERLEATLVGSGRATYLLDGDNLRHGLNGDLGFSEQDRRENIRRVGEVATLLADAGLVAVVPIISPYRSSRRAVRRRCGEAGVPFVEVHVATPLAVCEQRTPRASARARAGELSGMTGVDDPYEPPENAEQVVSTEELGVDEATAAVLALVSPTT
ncbi:MAG: adenylyl-sulfate kinase [Microthrixaceae bacterium]